MGDSPDMMAVVEASCFQLGCILYVEIKKLRKRSVKVECVFLFEIVPGICEAKEGLPIRTSAQKWKLQLLQEKCSTRLQEQCQKALFRPETFQSYLLAHDEK